MKRLLSYSSSKGACIGILLASLTGPLGSIGVNLGFYFGVLMIQGEASVSLASIALLMILSCFIEVIGGFMRSILTCKATEKNAKAIKTRILAAALDRDYLNQTHAGALLMRSTADADLVASAVPSKLVPLISTVIEIAMYTAVCLYFSWKATLVIWFSVAASIVVTKYYERKLKAAQKEKKEAEESMRVYMQDRLSTFPLWKIFFCKGEFMRKLNLSNQVKIEKSMNQKRVRQRQRDISNYLGYFSILLNLGACCYFVFTHDLSLAAMTVLIDLGQTIAWPVTDIPVFIADLMEADLAASRIEEIASNATMEPAEIKQPAQSYENISIQVEDLTFGYNGESPVLQHVNEKIDANTAACLTGQSGGGKTTLLNIISGLIKPQQGSVSFFSNGKPLDSVVPEQIISYVPQGNSLFYGTVRENIEMGRLGAPSEEIIAASKLAGCHEFIEQLPQQYDTMLGPEGQQISQGQMQRIAIARALLKQTPVIVFDEPTASLDAQSEEIITNTIRGLKRDKTCVVVSHRQALIDSCDQRIELAK